jgi:hypothetical protein
MYLEPVPKEVQWLSVPELAKRIAPSKEAVCLLGGLGEAVCLLGGLGEAGSDGDIPAALDEATEH